jgi:hypothetical protein
MDRRQMLTSGLGLGGLAIGGLLLSKNMAFADIPNSGSGKDLVGKTVDGLKIDSFSDQAIVTKSAAVNFTFLTVDFGMQSGGNHINEFNIPRGTSLILGQVQEGMNAGDALYTTHGIAIRAEGTGDWRGRVIWTMAWGGPPLPSIFRCIYV